MGSTNLVFVYVYIQIYKLVRVSLKHSRTSHCCCTQHFSLGMLMYRVQVLLDTAAAVTASVSWLVTGLRGGMSGGMCHVV